MGMVPFSDCQLPSSVSRRALFRSGGLSLASLAMSQLAAAETGAARRSHFAPRAKSVIFLFQVGGPSQLDLFDPKPEVNRRDGEELPESLLKKVSFAQIQEKRPRLMGSPYRFRQHGESGAWVSELMPHTAGIVDRITIARTLRTDDTNHMFAELLMNTGWRRFGRPSLGSWVSYGLGSQSQEMPAFLVLGSKPRSKSANYGNGFLPSQYQGTVLRDAGEPILNLSNPPGVTTRRQRLSIDAINQLNRLRLDASGDDEIRARIASYEMAYRMQARAPELLSLDRETPETLKLYGIDDPARPSFARNCLLARRLVEKGVRFVQVFHGDWDHHTDIGNRLPSECRVTDQGSAALVVDLARRGLLEDTLVVWGGELGRTPVAQKPMAAGGRVGRDHQIEAFTMWFAGGGVRPGQVIGETNDLGCLPAEDGWHVYDLQATILHALGLDHERLTYRYEGREFRLTDIYGEVKSELFATASRG